jgi:hypothetical protein
MKREQAWKGLYPVADDDDNDDDDGSVGILFVER